MEPIRGLVSHWLRFHIYLCFQLTCTWSGPISSKLMSPRCEWCKKVDQRTNSVLCRPKVDNAVLLLNISLCLPPFLMFHYRGWTFTIIILGAYSKVILLVLLSNFAQCAMPCASLNPVAQIPCAPSTTQNLKVTVIEWLLNMLLIWWL